MLLTWAVKPLTEAMFLQALVLSTWAVKPLVEVTSLQVLALSMQATKPLLVFAGPVHWTEKTTETKLNPTAKDQTTSCSCTNSENFQLPIARFVKKSKD